LHDQEQPDEGRPGVIVTKSTDEPSPSLLEFAEALHKKLVSEFDATSEWMAECLEEFVNKQHTAFVDLVNDLFHPVFAHMEDVAKRGGAPPSSLSHEEKLRAWEIEQRAKAALWHGVPFLTLVTQWMADTLDEQVRPYLSNAQGWGLYSWKQIGLWYNLTGEGVRKRFKLKDDADPKAFLAGMLGALWSNEAFSRWQFNHLTRTDEGARKMEEFLSQARPDADAPDISDTADD
jgi:hypothetical protein